MDIHKKQRPQSVITPQFQKRAALPLPQKPKKKRTYLWHLMCLCLVTVVATGLFMGHKVLHTAKQITVHAASATAETNDRSTLAEITGLAQVTPDALRGYAQGRINVLLLGFAGGEREGDDLTDTIMLANIDIETKRIALLSIPRDFLYYDATTKQYQKINALYAKSVAQHGNANDLLTAVETVTGQSVHYYLAADFTGFTDLIDALGGIHVTVDEPIVDERYPGPHYSYETFELPAGLQELDGATALKYVRTRHGDTRGDFGRAERQQRALQAIKNKVFSLDIIFNPLQMARILDIIAAHVQTNISLEELDAFAQLAKELDTQNTNTHVLDAWGERSLLRNARITEGASSGLVPRAGNYYEIQKMTEHIFSLNYLEQTTADIAKEDATITLINASGEPLLATRIDALLNTLGYGTVEHYTAPDTTLHTTTLIDRTATSPVSADTIMTTLPAKLGTVTTLSRELQRTYNKSPQTDFTLLLGRDIISGHLYEDLSTQTED